MRGSTISVGIWLPAKAKQFNQAGVEESIYFTLKEMKIKITDDNSNNNNGNNNNNKNN